MDKYRIRTYHDFKSFQRHIAKDFVQSIINQDIFSFTSYGISETEKKDILSIDILGNIVTGFPRYFNGKLFLFEKDNQLVLMIDYLVFEAVTITVFFNKPIEEEKALELFKSIISFDCCVFGAFDLEEEYENKHNYIDEDTEERLGEDFFKGLPGLYKCTFINNEIINELKIGDLKTLYEDCLSVKSGYLFINKRNAEQFPFKNQSFFDIKLPFKELLLPDWITLKADFLSSIERKEVPQYTNRNLQFSNDFVMSSLNEFDDFPILDLNNSLIEIENIMISFLTEFKSDKCFRKRIAVCGYRLSVFLSEKYALKHNEEFVIMVEKNRRLWFVNPFNIVALLFEDHLSLKDFFNYMEKSFKLN